MSRSAPLRPPERGVAVGPGARYLEDFTPGEVLVTQGRTLTDTDVVLWAMFTGDMNPMHVDEVHAAAHGLFGGRFPPGLMAVAIASGLKERLGLFSGTGLAMLEQTIRYRQPARAGDTLHVRLTVDDVERHAAKPRGVVRFGYAIVDQDDATVAEGEWVMVVAARDRDG